jgi:hypothetical protein
MIVQFRTSRGSERYQAMIGALNAVGIYKYGWYLWHYLYDKYLQQAWPLFAILFAFGGLSRREAAGRSCSASAFRQS